MQCDKRRGSYFSPCEGKLDAWGRDGGITFHVDGVLKVRVDGDGMDVSGKATISRLVVTGDSEFRGKTTFGGGVEFGDGSDLRLSWSEAIVNTSTPAVSSDVLSGLLRQNPSETQYLDGGLVVTLQNSKLTSRSTLMITAAPCTADAAPMTSVVLWPVTKPTEAAIHLKAPAGGCGKSWELRWLLVNGVDSP